MPAPKDRQGGRSKASGSLKEASFLSHLEEALNDESLGVHPKILGTVTITVSKDDPTKDGETTPEKDATAKSFARLIAGSADEDHSKVARSVATAILSDVWGLRRNTQKEPKYVKVAMILARYCLDDDAWQVLYDIVSDPDNDTDDAKRPPSYQFPAADAYDKGAKKINNAVKPKTKKPRAAPAAKKAKKAKVPDAMSDTEDSDAEASHGDQLQAAMAEVNGNGSASSAAAEVKKGTKKGAKGGGRRTRSGGATSSKKTARAASTKVQEAKNLQLVLSFSSKAMLKELAILKGMALCTSGAPPKFEDMHHVTSLLCNAMGANTLDLHLIQPDGGTVPVSVTDFVCHSANYKVAFRDISGIMNNHIVHSNVPVTSGLIINRATGSIKLPNDRGELHSTRPNLEVAVPAVGGKAFSRVIDAYSISMYAVEVNGTAAFLTLVPYNSGHVDYVLTPTTLTTKQAYDKIQEVRETYVAKIRKTNVAAVKKATEATKKHLAQLHKADEAHAKAPKAERDELSKAITKARNAYNKASKEAFAAAGGIVSVQMEAYSAMPRVEDYVQFDGTKEGLLLTLEDKPATKRQFSKFATDKARHIALCAGEELMEAFIDENGLGDIVNALKVMAKIIRSNERGTDSGLDAATVKGLKALIKHANNAGTKFLHETLANGVLVAATEKLKDKSRAVLVQMGVGEFVHKVGVQSLNTVKWLPVRKFIDSYTEDDSMAKVSGEIVSSDQRMWEIYEATDHLSPAAVKDSVNEADIAEFSRLACARRVACCAFALQFVSNRVKAITTPPTGTYLARKKKSAAVPDGALTTETADFFKFHGTVHHDSALLATDADVFVESVTATPEKLRPLMSASVSAVFRNGKIATAGELDSGMAIFKPSKIPSVSHQHVRNVIMPTVRAATDILCNTTCIGAIKLARRLSMSSLVEPQVAATREKTYKAAVAAFFEATMAAARSGGKSAKSAKRNAAQASQAAEAASDSDSDT